MKTLTFAVAEDIFIIVHGQASPLDEEWDRLLDKAEALHAVHKPLRSVVWTDGGAPTSAQRHRMNQRVRAMVARSRLLRARAAILGRSTFVRAVINASVALEGGWFGRVAQRLQGEPALSRVYRAFDQNELAQALAWLGIPAARVPEIGRIIHQLRDELRM